MSLTNVEVVDAVIRIMYNESPLKIFECVYQKTFDTDPQYAHEKMRAMGDLTAWWGQLDYDHRERLLTLAVRRYQRIPNWDAI